MGKLVNTYIRIMYLQKKKTILEMKSKDIKFKK